MSREEPVPTSYRGCQILCYQDGYLVTRPNGEWKWFYSMVTVRRWARAYRGLS
jgi:hypothetical protein